MEWERSVRLRILAVSLVAVLFAIGQVSGSAMSLVGYARAYAASPPHGAASTVLASDNSESSADNSSDTGSDNSDSSSDDSDNSDSSSDNSDASSDDGDNSDSDSNADGDNSDGGSSSATTSPSAAPIDDEALKQPLATATGTSNGSDSMVSMPGERVAVRIFPWLPSGIQLTIRPVDASTVASAPGKQAGDLTFAVEANDATGTQLTSLPSEVNLAIRYADSTVDGLNESNLKLSRLDPSTNQWQDAPKMVRETDSNYLGASIMQLGTYTVSAQ